MFNFKKPKTTAFLCLLFFGIAYLLWPLLWGRVFLISSRTPLFGMRTRRTLVCTNGAVFQDKGRNWFVNNATALVGLVTHNQVNFELGSGKEYVGLISKVDMKNLRSELGSAFVFSGRISPNDPDPNRSGSNTRTFIVFDADDDVSMTHDGPLPYRTIDKEEYKKYDALLMSSIDRGRAAGYSLRFYRQSKVNAWPFDLWLDPNLLNGVKLSDLKENERKQLDDYFRPRSSRQQNIFLFHLPGDLSQTYWVSFSKWSNGDTDLPLEGIFHVNPSPTRNIEPFAGNIGLTINEIDIVAAKAKDGVYDLPIDTPASKEDLDALNAVDSDVSFIRTDAVGIVYQVGISVDRLTKGVWRVDCMDRS